MKKFIITSDSKIAHQLMAGGFKLVSEVSGVYTFLNAESNFNFSGLDGGKIHFTNILSI